VTSVIGRINQPTNLEQGYKVNVMWTPSSKTPWTWSGVEIDSVPQGDPRTWNIRKPPELREHQS